MKSTVRPMSASPAGTVATRYSRFVAGPRDSSTTCYGGLMSELSALRCILLSSVAMSLP